jgi:hypothetical protein
MAQTWQDSHSALLPRNLPERLEESGTSYALDRGANGLVFRTSAIEMPIEAIVGGSRHGLSFLARLSEIDGLKLERPTLIETRFLHSTPHSRMELSAGFPTEHPTGFETALGRALTPEFEEKCLACHPKSGVQCESCHGAGKPHLDAVAKRMNDLQISKSTQSCAQCHSGFSPLADPMPEDLLISSQVTALANSECALQSGGGVTCLQCHDPHQDAKNVAARSVQTCSRCHAVEASTKSRCLECHMPVAKSGSFEMVDHWIRVHQERGDKSPHTVNPSSKSVPRQAYLRMIAVADRSQAETLRDRVLGGESFFELARDNSLDRTKVSGGYLGNVELPSLNPAWRDAVLKLGPGGVTPVIETSGKFVLLQRFPRYFRWQAAQLAREAGQLKTQGKLADAAQKYLEALQIYPRFLRGLIFLGATLGEQGNTERAVATLEFASKLYPGDAAAKYNLGIAYDAAGKTDDAQREYREAIEIEPSLTPAYQNLGADLLAAGDLGKAVVVFRAGLRENPLSAILNYDLGLALEKQQDTEAARAAMDLAKKLDPGLLRSH